MGTKQIPDIPDFEKIKTLLDTERKTFIRENDFSNEDEYVRSTGDAVLILDFLCEVQTEFWRLFNRQSSLISIFNRDFSSFQEFIQRDMVLEICFIDDCLFPDKDLFYFAEDGKILPDVLEDYKETFRQWIIEMEGAHLSTQEKLSTDFDIKLKFKELQCQCVRCASDFRTILRDTIYNECLEFVKDARDKIEESVSDGIEKTSNIYRQLQKNLDKKFFSIRYQLKRTALNRLENQIKKKIRDIFVYPSELPKKHVENLNIFFASLIKEQGLSDDLIAEVEYDRFYKRLSTNIWKNERYLEREFAKLVRTVLMLKRKDISAKILTDYLGGFWNFSRARMLNRKIIYHMGPTNSGKTYYAVEQLCKAKSGCYLAPLRLLAAELYDTMNAKNVPTTLLTGEECIEVDGANHYSSTVEMARFEEKFDCAVIDEIQMMSDSWRGWAWTRALVNINAKEIHICGDHTALDLVSGIARLCGDSIEIKKYERMTKLIIEDKSIVIGELRRSDAVIVFSRRNALKFKADLERIGFKVSIIYGRLGPEVRREQARKFDHGETDIIVSTDAIAMGMNLPIRRIVFSTMSKFIMSEEIRITKSEIMQISGRAGRYGRFPTGYLTCLTREKNGIEEIKEAMAYDLPQKEKCMVGPDLDIYKQVNDALKANSLPLLSLPEFFHLFNNMNFEKPFYCADLKEMIELAEMVEEIDKDKALSFVEKFGFACTPVDLRLVEHVQYFVFILNNFVCGKPIKFSPIDTESNDIDYLETSIKCVELFQWLSRHFKNKNFQYDLNELLHNKGLAIEKLNLLLSDKIIPLCASCGLPLEEDSRFSICENCFKRRRFRGRKKTDTRTTEKNADRKNNRKKSPWKTRQRSAQGPTTDNKSKK